MKNLKGYLQTACVVMVSVGVVMEICLGADVWYAVITMGALMFGISTKIEKRVKKG